MTQRQLTIKETAQRSGFSASVLRVWEVRYGWPQPKRKPNGYRYYHPSILEDLEWVASRLAVGKTIGDLVREGELVREDLKNPCPVPRRVTYDFTDIPQPSTDDGKKLRQRLEVAIANSDHGEIALLTSLAARLRPTERESAVSALLKRVSGTSE